MISPIQPSKVLKVVVHLLCTPLCNNAIPVRKLAQRLLSCGVQFTDNVADRNYNVTLKPIVWSLNLIETEGHMLNQHTKSWRYCHVADKRGWLNHRCTTSGGFVGGSGGWSRGAIICTNHQLPRRLRTNFPSSKKGSIDEDESEPILGRLWRLGFGQFAVSDDSKSGKVGKNHKDGSGTLLRGPSSSYMRWFVDLTLTQQLQVLPMTDFVEITTLDICAKRVHRILEQCQGTLLPAVSLINVADITCPLLPNF